MPIHRGQQTGQTNPTAGTARRLPPPAPSPADTQPTMSVPATAGRRPVPPRTVAQPQRIPAPAQPAGGAAAEVSSRKRPTRLVMGAAIGLVVALAAVVLAFVAFRDDNSPPAQVRAAITTYTDALAAGDLAVLQQTTCGSLHQFYRDIPIEQFDGVHQLSVERQDIPVIDSIDAIRITEDTAITQATVYTEADPANRSARTFDLQRTDDGWKVCDPPSGTQ
ncbi:hypothetical protein [Nocardia sp. CNY236]|uniref:Rv0361 family membrane protein n=1 Tax=Nocardia sp. CNY236 TaxID=1169152 RepID=UPI0012DE7633|nr:hypothetical protein [Nocardia sp. CNY236]